MAIAAVSSWILFCWIYVTWVHLQCAKGDTDPDEVRGLLELYDILDSPPLTGWGGGFGSDPCRDAWEGITCDLDGSIVTKIELPGLNLNGSLDMSSSLHMLQHLAVLDLSNNQLRGAIPNRLPDSLVLLNLQRNKFDKNIPWSLGKLNLMTELRLAHNNLTGSILDNFEELKSLITLDLADNSFTGAIPPSMGLLPSLTFLYLQNNRLDSGLHVLKELNLRTLDIRENSFHEQKVPEWVQEIPSFQYSEEEFSPFFPPPWGQNSTSLPDQLPPAYSPAPVTLDQSNPLGPAREQQAESPERGAVPTTIVGNSVGTFISPSILYVGASAPPEYGVIIDSGEEEDRKDGFLWSPERIAGVTAAVLLSALAFGLLFLYFKWWGLDKEEDDWSGSRKQDFDTPWRGVGNMQRRDLKYW